MSPVSSPPRITHPLARGIPPRWASGWGQDLHGPWCALTVNDVTRRLRWIPPGRFLMGSPEDEDGRWEGEGPRHPVRIETGFWMFETPCTQALWQAVMGANPSRFQGADRPVETVSWDDCRAFIARLNERLDGLQLSLPSEAQWEYACRAGTTSPRYQEDLGEIAWYAENSGDETHAVRGKAPNAWGLYDMLGNVWEWCADAWIWYGKEQNVSEASASALRVLRGGSWVSDPRSVRAACRRGVEPSYRYDNVGFRCSEFRSGS